MTARGQWMFDPNSGGNKIAPSIQAEVERRIRKVSERLSFTSAINLLQPASKAHL
jgi:hypothetical protein